MGANGTIPSYNLFAYCENNPINNMDLYGNKSININKLKKESWVIRGVAKYLNITISRSKDSRTIFSTPKWLGIYLELSVSYGWQSNASGIISFGFSRGSFDVSICHGSGKMSVACGIGITWTQTYLIASIIYSPKNYGPYFAINLKFGIYHLTHFAVAAICAYAPSITPVVWKVYNALFKSVKYARPVVKCVVPFLLGVK